MPVSNNFQQNSKQKSAPSLKSELTRDNSSGFGAAFFLYEKVQKTRTSGNENMQKSNNYILQHYPPSFQQKF